MSWLVKNRCWLLASFPSTAGNRFLRSREGGHRQQAAYHKLTNEGEETWEAALDPSSLSLSLSLFQSVKFRASFRSPSLEAFILLSQRFS